ncbi:hypothetical protein PMAYCL1PPCAC_26349, partial [Pristionchus mayeri]
CLCMFTIPFFIHVYVHSSHVCVFSRILLAILSYTIGLKFSYWSPKTSWFASIRFTSLKIRSFNCGSVKCSSSRSIVKGASERGAKTSSGRFQSRTYGCCSASATEHRSFGSSTSIRSSSERALAVVSAEGPIGPPGMSGKKWASGTICSIGCLSNLGSVSKYVAIGAGNRETKSDPSRGDPIIRVIWIH